MADVHIVQLDRDHPGFRDESYRKRRDAIALMARDNRVGAPVVEVEYTAEEHATWATVVRELRPLQLQFACQEYLDEWPHVNFHPERIPSFREINERLSKRSGFALQPVAGLVTAREFVSALGDGTFYATQYMRHTSTPLYTPEPDVVHEFIGHVPLLSHPMFADMQRRFGAAAKRATEAQMVAIDRIYWYAMEFSLMKDGKGGHKAVGAGLLSSFGELGQFGKADLRPFDLRVMAELPFDPTYYQRTLFVGDSVEQMMGDLRNYLNQI
jgi:phenylalanine-4-hydroxylase